MFNQIKYWIAALCKECVLLALLHLVVDLKNTENDAC